MGGIILKTKKVLLILLTLALIFTLVGCKSEDVKDINLSINKIGQGEVVTEGDIDKDNGVVTLKAIPAKGWEFKEWTGNLEGTENPVQVVVADNMDIAAVFTKTGEESTIKYEAELGILNGTEVSSDNYGYSGDGYVTSLDNEGDAVTVKVNIEDEGMYDIIMGYNGPNGEKTNNLLINGVTKGEVKTPKTTGFTEILAGKVWLDAGENSIGIGKSWGWIDIDYFKVKKEESSRNELNPTKELVNPNASNDTKALMSFLVDTYGQKIIAGAQNSESATWLNENIGKEPAVLSLDLMDYSPSRVEFGASTNDVEEAIDWFQKGGIVSLCWHWNAPKDLINEEPDKLWWSGFYTKATTFDVEYAMNHPESEDYQLIIRDLDAIAKQLKRLQDAGAPVLWRPLHEAEGGWFWWGAKGPEPLKKLWKLMYDRFTNYHDLNNLIWVWTADDGQESPEWYPGDQYVDIIGADIYLDSHNYSPSTAKFYNLVDMYPGKLVAMTEDGTIPDPELLQKEAARWSWFSSWSVDLLLRDNTLEHIEKVYNDDYVITLDELKNMENYPF